MCMCGKESEKLLLFTGKSLELSLWFCERKVLLLSTNCILFIVYYDLEKWNKLIIRILLSWFTPYYLLPGTVQLYVGSRKLHGSKKCLCSLNYQIIHNLKFQVRTIECNCQIKLSEYKTYLGFERIKQFKANDKAVTIWSISKSDAFVSKQKWIIT